MIKLNQYREEVKNILATLRNGDFNKARSDSEELMAASNDEMVRNDLDINDWVVIVQVYAYVCRKYRANNEKLARELREFTKEVSSFKN